MFVVEIRATGIEIFFLSMCWPGFRALAERVGIVGGTSERRMRFVIARARDIMTVFERSVFI